MKEECVNDRGYRLPEIKTMAPGVSFTKLVCADAALGSTGNGEAMKEEDIIAGFIGHEITWLEVDGVWQESTSPINVSIDTTTANLSFASQGQVVFTIRPDLTVEFNPAYRPDETARRFWEAILTCGPSLELEALRAENVELKAQVALLKVGQVTET